MKTIYRVVTMVSGMRQDSDTFNCFITKHEAKETANSYTWKGTRLAKTQIGRIENIYQGPKLVGYASYVEEEQLETAKRETHLAVEKEVTDRLQALTAMYAMLQKEPKTEMEERDVNNDLIPKKEGRLV